MNNQSPVTKGYLDKRLDGVVASIRGEIRDGIRHFNQSQAEQNKRLDGIESQLRGLSDDMVKVKIVLMDYIGTDRAVHNLVRELKGQGIKLDERKIFAF
ncbi:MAG: hypothetical protein HY566_03200 [Candidatus Kerfeldbacteria bacterium]|nr:hypothetical protein [Candidatus Kerfeldbacteria bacterium]